MLPSSIRIIAIDIDGTLLDPLSQISPANLDALQRFYEQGLGLTLLFRFENHEGFDGIMLGRPGAPYHFEFTRAHNHTAGRAPNAGSPGRLLTSRCK